MTYRRYNDFEWLRDTLIKFYPGFVIPPIPKKHLQRNFEETFLIKRKCFLENFLNDLLRCDEIRNEEIVNYFLEMNETEFAQYR